jgi:cysteine-rich repeat protein
MSHASTRLVILGGVLIAASCHESLWLDNARASAAPARGGSAGAPGGRSGAGGSFGRSGFGGTGGAFGSDEAGGQAGSDAAADASSTDAGPDSVDSGDCYDANCEDAEASDSADAAPSSYCGDGTIDEQLGEECDDRNRTSGDGCDDCRFTCIPDSVQRGCGDVCAGYPPCNPITHLCAPGTTLLDATPCAPGHACKSGRCQASEPVSGRARFDFTGFVTGGSGLGNDVKVGDEILGYYVFDPTQSNSSNDPTYGLYVYDDAPGEFEIRVKVGKVHFLSTEIAEANIGRIGVENEYLGRTDRYSVFYGEDRSGSQWDTSVHLWMATDINLDALFSSALPLTPPQLDKFETTQFQLDLRGSSGVFVFGHITSLTRSF